MDAVGGEEGHLCAMVEKALRAKCKVGVSPQEDEIFDYTA